MKDIIYSFSVVLCIFTLTIILGMGLGNLLDYLHTKEPIIWYCIDGKIHEKNGDFYISVSPTRTCLPVKE